MELDISFYVYMMSNNHNTVIYTGRSSDLQRRVKEHKQKLFPKSFTARYNVSKLVFYEVYAHHDEAIERERQIKAGSRIKKIKLIEAQNPDWLDLSRDWEL